MAHQHNEKHQKQGCIQLIRCIPPTDEERKNPQYVPQLEINPQAQRIIAERFEAPISVIVYVGNVGVGKSKLATVAVAALEKEPHDTDLLWFRSGADCKGITQGVWMWCEPLRHPDQDEKTNGSILILDCEGMGNLDENTGANLYFFCMIISTIFAVVLRPARIDRFQCDRLCHALRRFEVMKSSHVLPNVWLLPLDLPKFLNIDRNTNDEVEISKDEWLHEIFSVDEDHNNLSSVHNQRLKEEYEYIIRMLPQIDTINIEYLPQSLTNNNQSLDVYALLRMEESAAYLKSINTVIRALLTSGGKQLLGSNVNNLFIQPTELADFMGELINVINRDNLPNPDKLIEDYLRNRFIATIEKESWTQFKCDLLQCANDVLCEERKQLEEPQKEEERLEMDKRMKQHHKDLVTKYYDAMICRARHEITGHDLSLVPEFKDEEERQHAFFYLPTSIQERLSIIEAEMKNYQDPVIIIEQPQKTIIESWRRWTYERKTLLDKAYQELHKTNGEYPHKNRINEPLIVNEEPSVELTPFSKANLHFFENTPDENSINISIDQILEHVYKANENNDDIPKLFVVLPDPAYVWNDLNPWENKYLLHVICECSNEKIHFSTYPGYSIPNSRVFFENYKRYLNEFMIPIAKHIHQRDYSENRDTTFWQNYKKGLKKMEKILNDSMTGNCSEINTVELLTYLTLPNQRVFTDLYRFVDNNGSVRWLCNKHYPKEQLNLIEQLYKNGIEFDKRLGVLYVDACKISDLILCLKSGLSYYGLYLVDVRFPFDLSQVLINALWKRPPKKIYVNSSWPLDCNTIDRLNHVEYQSSFKDKINITSLIEWLDSIKCLISLRLPKLTMSETETKNLFMVLQNNSILRKLEFERRNFEFSETIATELTVLLCKSQTLTHVDLSYSHLDDECMRIIGNGLCQSISYTLKDLCLDWNKITDKSSSILCEITEKFRLIRFSLAHNKLSFNGIQSIIKTVSVNETILYFNIAACNCTVEDNNRSDAKVGCMIANMLNNNKTLIDLNISAIRLNEQDIELIAQSLRTNRTLTHIQLGDDNFGDTHLEQLTNTSLIHISLYETRWTSAGMDCLSKFLSENCTLRELTISKCRMTDACTIMFDNILSMNRTLTHLNLSNNREMIGDQGARALADMLQVNKTLTYLNIRNNYISNDGAKAIAESLLKNRTLTELDISDNNCITEKGFEIFAITLLGNETLLFLITGYRMPDVFKQMLQTSRDNLIVYKQ